MEEKDFIGEIVKFQNSLRSLNHGNVEAVKQSIVDSVFTKSEHGIREIAHEIVFIPSVTNIDVNAVASLLVSLNKIDCCEFLKKLKTYVAEEIINPSKEANNKEKSFAFNLLRKCYIAGLYNDTNIFEYVQRFPKSRKLNFFLLFSFMAPEIQRKSPELFTRLKRVVESIHVSDKTVQNYINNFDTLPLLDLIEYGCEKNSDVYKVVYGDASSVADDTVLPNTPFAPFSSLHIKTAGALKAFLQGKQEVKEEKLTKSDMFDAALNDDVNTLIKCIDEYKINVNAVNPTGMTALHCAASLGHELCVRILVERGARINKKNDWGETCLHYAAKYGSFCTVEYLVTKGGDIFAEDSSRWTPFIDSVDSGSLPISIFLATKGSDMNRRARDGKAPLHIAASNDYLPLCEFLVMNGAAIDSKDDTQKTALHIAASEGNLNICEFLCVNSAEIDSRDLSGRTPLHYAAFYGHVDVVESLIDHGANPDSVDTCGSTPIMLAAAGGFLACVECLVYKKADIFIVDNAGKTALELAQVPEIRDYLGSLV